jgi:serine/threonine-protein kinase RsbT
MSNLPEVAEIRSQADIVLVRQKVREWTVKLGFSLVEQTKIITAASELARNTIEYGNGGTVTIEALQDGNRTGIGLTFEDRGPGIADLNLAMQDGYTTGKGLGLGLGGSKRLMHEFIITSEVGKGTCVRVTRWR